MSLCKHHYINSDLFDFLGLKIVEIYKIYYKPEEGERKEKEERTEVCNRLY
jgi:hypothetical protein